MVGPATSNGNRSSEFPRVLIVEPKRDYLAVLARRIGEAGYAIATADKAIAALAELQRQPISLVLSELRMDGTGGIELCRMIREDPACRDVPVILITGKSDADGAIQAYQAGADVVVAKPFHFEVLVARIAREIERAKAVKKLREDNAALDARVIGRAIELGEVRDRLLQSEAERRRLERMIGSGGA